MNKKTNKSRIQLLRFVSVLMVILFFVFIPISNKYANFKIAYNQGRLVELSDGKVYATFYNALDWFYSLFPDPVIAATSNNGSLWAYTIFGVPISDPLGLLSELISSVHFPMKYLIGGLIPYLLALLLGRFFCGWLCPMIAINKIAAWVRKGLLFFKVPLLEFKISVYTRVFVFWGGLVLSYLFGMWTWHFILPYISFTHEIFSLVIFQSFTVGIYFLLSVFLLEVAVIPGQYCKSICPTGLLLSWFGRVQLFRLKTDSSNCPKGCHVCFDVCPVDLYPKNNELHSCHLCSVCVTACPESNIEFGVTDYLNSSKKKESYDE
ncbi:MAG: 4Fe-4S binding protein [Reichenbachiella sp.]